MSLLLCTSLYFSILIDSLIKFIFFSIIYAYISRFFAISPLTTLKPEDPDFIDARQTISQLLPFLVDKKSTTVLPNLSALVTDLWSRFEPVSHSAYSRCLVSVIHITWNRRT